MGAGKGRREEPGGQGRSRRLARPAGGVPGAERADRRESSCAQSVGGVVLSELVRTERACANDAGAFPLSRGGKGGGGDGRNPTLSDLAPRPFCPFAAARTQTRPPVLFASPFSLHTIPASSADAERRCYVWDGRSLSLASSNALDPAPSSDRRSSLLSRWLLRRVARLRHDFFPDPANVTPDYWQYWRWRAGHRFFSSMNSALTTQSLLLAVGAGGRGTAAGAGRGGLSASLKNARTGPSAARGVAARTGSSAARGVAAGTGSRASMMGAAGAAWVLKDGLGRLGRLAVAARFGTGFDADLKRWRFATSILYCFSGGLEIASPFFPRAWFVPLAAAANAGKGIGLVTHLSTQPAFYRSLAKGETTADVAAKCQAQQTVADALGMAAAVFLAGSIARAQRGGTGAAAGATGTGAAATLPRSARLARIPLARLRATLAPLAGRVSAPLAPLASRLSRLPPYALPAVAFPILSALDLVCIAGELRSVHLRAMNAERAEALARAWVAGLREPDQLPPLLPSPREVSRREGLLLPSRLLATRWWAEEARGERGRSALPPPSLLPSIPPNLCASVPRLPPTPCAWLCPLDRALRSESAVDAFVASLDLLGTRIEGKRSAGGSLDAMQDGTRSAAQLATPPAHPHHVLSSPRYAAIPDPSHPHRLLVSLRADATPSDALEAVLSSVLFGAKETELALERGREARGANGGAGASSSTQPTAPGAARSATARPRHPPASPPTPPALDSLPLALPPSEVPAEPAVGARAMAARAHAAEALPAFRAALEEAGWEPNAFVFGSAGKERWSVRKVRA